VLEVPDRTIRNHVVTDSEVRLRQQLAPERQRCDMQRCGMQNLTCGLAHPAHQGNHCLCSPRTTITSTCGLKAHTTTKLAEWFAVDPNTMSFSDLGHICRCRLPTRPAPQAAEDDAAS